ncbi:hypothetical protein FOB31_13605 [Burkholderia multivorans]|nr:hypothetical protein FOB31_13605 [Burkholderia multivorans]QET41815.1 hypothetical protein FOB30_30260 [Burkholderia multivorans]
MTYAQFHASSPDRGCVRRRATSDSYVIVFIEFSENAGVHQNRPEGRPARLSGQSAELFNKVIHIRCG